MKKFKDIIGVIGMVFVVVMLIAGAIVLEEYDVFEMPINTAGEVLFIMLSSIPLILLPIWIMLEALGIGIGKSNTTPANKKPLIERIITGMIETRIGAIGAVWLFWYIPFILLCANLQLIGMPIHPTLSAKEWVILGIGVPGIVWVACLYIIGMLWMLSLPLYPALRWLKNAISSMQTRKKKNVSMPTAWIVVASGLIFIISPAIFEAGWRLAMIQAILGTGLCLPSLFYINWHQTCGRHI